MSRSPRRQRLTIVKGFDPLRLTRLTIWWGLWGVTVAGKNTFNFPCHPLQKSLLKFGHFLNRKLFARHGFDTGIIFEGADGRSCDLWYNNGEADGTHESE
jgi:hypothetical protein